MLLIKLLFCLTIFTAVLSSDESLQKDDKFEDIKLTKLEFHINQEKYKQKLEELSKVLLRANNDAEKTAILNDYVDELLPFLNSFISGNDFNRVELPGFDASFKWTIFTGWIVLDNGILNGVSTFIRTGDVTVRYNYPHLKFRIPLGFSKLNFSYNYEVKFMYLGPTGEATGQSKGNKFTVDLIMNMTTLRAKLDNFDLKTLGSVSLWFSGNILTDWIINIIMVVIMPILKPILGMVIEGYVVDGLENVLKIYNTIICTALNDC